MALNKSLFITLEGGDGTGKSSVAQKLAERFKAYNHETILTREPGGTPLGLELRRILLHDGHQHSQEVQLLMLNAARLAHWEQVIQPNLQKGHHVLCDRFVDSTRVYQALSQNNSEKLLNRVNKLHQEFLPDANPDIVIVLDLDPKESIKRIQKRSSETNYFDDQPIRFHQTIRDGFLKLAQQGEPYSVVNASEPLDQVVQKCWSIILSKLG